MARLSEIIFPITPDIYAFDSYDDVERVWREFDKIYPMFRSNGSYEISMAIRQYTYLNHYGEAIIMTVGYYERAYDTNIFNVRIMANGVVRNFEISKEMIYAFIDSRIIF